MAALIGCSPDNPASPGEDASPADTVAGQRTITSGRSLWGVWEVAIDPVTLRAGITPVRFANFHANVRQFVEESPCTNCLSIVPPIVPQLYGLDVNLSLTHPFPRLSYYTGFDVRGIVMLEGDYRFPALRLTTTRAPAGGWALRNPDGYTPMFNALDYTLPGVLGYSRGRMVPPTWLNPTNTLNAFN